MDWLRLMLIALACLVILYAGLHLLAALWAPCRIYPVPTPSYAFDEQRHRRLPLGPGQPSFVLTLQGAPNLADLPNALPGAGQRVILYFHGNATDLGYVQSRIESLTRYGFAVCAVDYPGYGLSEGRPSEAAIFACADRAYQYLMECGYQPEQIVVWGRSLGSGPACYIASRLRCERLILETPFSSTYRVITRRKCLLDDQFDNLARAPQIGCPTLLIHGTEDRVVPFGQAQKLADAIGGPVETLWVQGGGHNDLPTFAGPAYWETVLNFAVNRPRQPVPLHPLPNIGD